MGFHRRRTSSLKRTCHFDTGCSRITRWQTPVGRSIQSLTGVLNRSRRDRPVGFRCFVDSLQLYLRPRAWRDGYAPTEDTRITGPSQPNARPGSPRAEPSRVPETPANRESVKLAAPEPPDEAMIAVVWLGLIGVGSGLVLPRPLDRRQYTTATWRSHPDTHRGTRRTPCD